MEKETMTYKLFAIAAMSLSLGSTTALATQSDTTGGAEMSGMQHGSMPMEWEGDIGDAFFSDTERGTLHSSDEMRENWDDLSDEDQDKVRDHCESDAMDDERAMMERDTGAASNTQTGQTGSAAGTDSGMEADATTGTDTMADADAGMHRASILEICEMIEDDNDS